MKSFKSCISKVILVFAITLMSGILGYTNVQAQGDDQCTKLLLHMDDSSFKDECGHMVTNNNGVTLGNSMNNFNKSAYFNGSSYMTYPNSTDWDFGSDDFTIDFCIMTPTVPSTQQVIIDSRSGLVTKRWVFNTTTEGKIRFLTSTDGTSWNGDVKSSTSLIANTWNHIAVVRYGSTITMYLNGTSVGSSSISGSIVSDTGLITIGNVPNGSSYYFKGNIDELRISKGVAIWKANFTPPTKPYSCATEITLDKTSIDLPVDGTYPLIATITPDNATNKTVKWTSDKPEIATVDPLTGKVTAKAEGTATITATTTDGSNLSANCTVNVTKAPVIATSITLSKSTESLLVDESRQLTATIAPADATTSSIIWTSSDSSTVSVDANGKITGEKEGTAIITATIKDTNISTTCVVTVKPKDTIPTDNIGNAILTITMTNGNVKAYTLPMTEVDKFKNWYDNRVSGSTGKAYYTFDKTDNLQPFSKKTEYIVFDKISSYEVDEYSK